MKEEDKTFLYSLIPKWAKEEPPKGYGEMFYGTLSYKEDVKVYERVQMIFNGK